MAGFVYFLPINKPIASFDDLPDVGGIRWTLRHSTWSNAETINGPEGMRGLVISPEPKHAGGVQADCGFFPDRQQWRAIDRGKLWIGWEREALPGPADLVRSPDDFVSGHGVVLGDARAWIVPAVHAPRTKLPQVMELDGDRWTPRPLPEYEAVMDASAKWWDLIQTDSPVFVFDDWCRFAVQLLSVNYRLGPHECSILGLFRTTATMLVSLVEAALDGPAIAAELAAQKKTVTRQGT